ncbi:GNAT family N-acetyltransferase [Actinomadura namibiensis]|uniref:GNAT family N-acetyltransferase n=1 Tax=Actinomadura kijaniata TaxID=46161 RepID=UPI001602839D
MPVDNDVVFRDIPEADIERALELVYLAFHGRPEEERREHHRRLLQGCERIGAYDGDTLVGTLCAFPFTMSVPGGELPCPGVTFVSVAPTHRRRGVLSGMMRELFRRCAADGRPMAALWASESVIYGRFGYGEGTRGLLVEIDARRPLALRIEPDGRPLRLVSPEDAPELLAPYYERTRAGRAGRIARTERWWREEWLAEKDSDDEELSPPRIVALGEPLAGYAIYRTRSGDEDTGRPGVLWVYEIEADSPHVAAALWRYLVSIDLIGVVKAWGRPADDPLLLFAADRDQVKVTAEWPGLWVRLVDARAALESRSWAADIDLALEVRDGLAPGNAGVHRLTVKDGVASCRPSEDAPDLTFEVRDLAACYLGGTRAAHAVQAGVATEHTPGSAALLDAALATGHLPHTVDEF